MDKGKVINPLPGEILLEEFLKPMGFSRNKLAMELRVPCRRINEIIRGRRSITADTALRLARFFGTTPDFWLNLQKSYDWAAARETLQTELPLIRVCPAVATA